MFEILHLHFVGIVNNVLAIISNYKSNTMILFIIRAYTRFGGRGCGFNRGFFQIYCYLLFIMHSLFIYFIFTHYLKWGFLLFLFVPKYLWGLNRIFIFQMQYTMSPWKELASNQWFLFLFLIFSFYLFLYRMEGHSGK